VYDKRSVIAAMADTNKKRIRKYPLKGRGPLAYILYTKLPLLSSRMNGMLCRKL
jgi:hypothetical protein